MTIFFQGGAGKHFAFTTALKAVTDERSDFVEPINVLSAYPQFFEGIPGVRRSVPAGTPYGYEDYCRGQQVLWVEPYRDESYFDGSMHLVQCCLNQMDQRRVQYSSERHFPHLPKVLPQQRAQVEAVAKSAGKGYVLLQLFGGTPDPKQVNQDMGAKHWPTSHVVKFLTAFRKKYPDLTLVNFGWDSEVPEDLRPVFRSLGVASTDGVPSYVGPHLLLGARSFVAIDSCLQHFSALKEAPRGVVLWGSTNPKNLSYPKNTNLTHECTVEGEHIHCNRPYPTMPTSDFDGTGTVWQCPAKTCIMVDPERVLEALSVILEGQK